MRADIRPHPTVGITEVTLAVTNLTRSLAFYERALGLQALTVDEGRAQLRLADGHRLCLDEAGVRGHPQPNEVGLYHLALLYPSRGALANALYRLANARQPLQGASDHRVSEALYLADPDGNGLELYHDRPVAGWPRTATGRPDPLGSWPLSLERLLAEATPAEPTTPRIGHLHVVVGNLAKAYGFFVEDLGVVVNVETPHAVFSTWSDYHHDLAFRVVPGQGQRWNPHATGLRSFTVEHLSGPRLTHIRHQLNGTDYPHVDAGDSITVTSPDGVQIRLLAH